MDPRIERVRNMTRRHFFKESQAGLGAMALASLLAKETPADTGKVVDPLAPRPPHFAPKAKRVIYLPHRLPASSRPLRLQAGAGQAHGAGMSRRLYQGQAVRLHDGHPEAARHATEIRPARQEWGMAVGRDPQPTFSRG